MKTSHLALLGVAVLIAVAVLAIPEAHTLAFAPIDPALGLSMLCMAAAVPITSNVLRGYQKKAAQLGARIDELSDLESKAYRSGDKNKANEHGDERIRLTNEQRALQSLILEEHARVRRDSGLDGSATGALYVVNDSADGDFLRSVSRPARDARFNGRRYADMWPREPRSDDGFENIGEFLKALSSGLTDPRLIQASTGAGEGIGADGGFMVPTAFAADLMDASLEDEIVRPRALIRPMEYNSAFVSGFDTQDHSATIGGFTGVWQSEGNKFTAQKAKVRALTLNAQKLGILAAATRELVADSAYYQDELYGLLAKATGWYLDLAFLTGTGAGQPKGVLNDPALVVVNKESGQATNTLLWANLAAMYERLHPACITNAVWVFNVGTRKALLGMFQPAAVTGGAVVAPSQPVLQQRANGSFTVLGLPALFTEKTPAFSSQGDVILADFSQYAVGVRKQLELNMSQHLYFDSDELAYRALVRADGRGRWSQAMQPKNGATLSWCVTLQAR